MATLAPYTAPVLSARLEALRDQLRRDGLDGFVVPLTDEHMSEYVGDYARRLEWLTGFGGSAGSAIVLADRAAIFVDGRYRLQVRAQVDCTAFEPIDVPQGSPTGWLTEAAPEGARLGYDPWLHTVAQCADLAAAIVDRGGALVAVGHNPIDSVWDDRPPPSPAPMIAHPLDFAGMTSADKRAQIADHVAAQGIDATVVTALDSLAWLLNIRGSDVEHTPVGLGFALLYADATVDLFTAAGKVDAALALTLGNGVRLHDHADFAEKLAGFAGKRVAVDPERAVAAIADALTAGGATIVPMRDPCVLAKAIKNPAEIAGTRAAHTRDGAALSRFLHWLETSAPGGRVTEIGAAEQLRSEREAGGALIDLSFDTISGSGPNGAIMHYRVSPATDRRLMPNSVYLVDSGGQYRDGTTDVTRTVWIGPDAAPAQVRDRFTRVLKGHIALVRAVFPPGTSGGQLDALARQFLWAAGCDYAHGTGHGVGSFLSVHEGPQRIAKPTGGQAGTSEPLVAGMILSNEPGYYRDGEYGIRIENLVLVVERAIAGGDAAMLGFETLTFVPIGRELIDSALLTADERAWIDGYHAEVFARVGPQLDGADADWLANACRPL